MMKNIKVDTGSACLYPHEPFEEANIKHCGTIGILILILRAPDISNLRTSFECCAVMPPLTSLSLVCALAMALCSVQPCWLAQVLGPEVGIG